MKSTSSNSIEKIKKFSSTNVLIVIFVLVLFAVYNVDFFASLPQTKYKLNSENCSCPTQKTPKSKTLDKSHIFSLLVRFTCLSNPHPN